MPQDTPCSFSRSFACQPIFAFDLDATITTREILPCLAECLGVSEEMAELTRRTVQGELDFALSFRRRFEILRSIPLPRAHESIASITLDPYIENFIKRRKDDCVIITGNLDLWISPLHSRLDCLWFSSRGAIKNNELVLLSILDKGEAMHALARTGRPIVAIGESANDVPMFEHASVGIAFAGVHEPAPEIQKLASCTVYNGASLCSLLDRLAEDRETPSYLYAKHFSDKIVQEFGLPPAAKGG